VEFSASLLQSSVSHDPIYMYIVYIMHNLKCMYFPIQQENVLKTGENKLAVIK